MRALFLAIVLMPLLAVNTTYATDNQSDDVAFERGQMQQGGQGGPGQTSRKVPGYGRYQGYNKYQTPAYQNRYGNPNTTNSNTYGTYPTTSSPVIINTPSTTATPSMYGPAPHQ